jgi:hypothetical protein
MRGYRNRTRAANLARRSARNATGAPSFSGLRRLFLDPSDNYRRRFMDFWLFLVSGKGVMRSLSTLFDPFDGSSVDASTASFRGTGVVEFTVWLDVAGSDGFGVTGCDLTTLSASLPCFLSSSAILMNPRCCSAW